VRLKPPELEKEKSKHKSALQGQPSLEGASSADGIDLDLENIRSL
jgi:hypothetical protein